MSTEHTTPEGQIWPIPPEVLAARKQVFDIHGEIETGLTAIENYAKTLNIVACDSDLDDIHAAAVSQISSDISERASALWDAKRDLMGMLPAELHDYWAFGNAGDEADGGYEKATGDVTAEPSEIARLIAANKSAWAAMHEASDEEETNRDEPSPAWNAATKAEEDTLMAVCAYRCRTPEEASMRAEYLLTMPDAEHRLNEFEFVEAMLRSSMMEAAPTHNSSGPDRDRRRRWRRP